MAKKHKKYTREELLEIIYKKYSTIEELGKVLGLSRQGASDKIDRQSTKFMNDLRDRAGLDLDASFRQVGNNNMAYSTKSESDPKKFADMEERIKSLEQDKIDLRRTINLLEQKLKNAGKNGESEN